MKTVVITVVAITLLGMSNTHVVAQTPFQNSISDVASAVKEFLKEKDENTIRVQFLGLPSHPGGGSLGFTQSLQQEFEKNPFAGAGDRVIRIGAKANFGLVAQLEEIDARGGQVGIRIKGKIYDRRGTEVKTLDPTDPITDGQHIAEALGFSVDFGASRNSEERNRRFQNARNAETIYVSTDRKFIFDQEKGNYGLAVRVVEEYRTITEDVEGLAFVPLKLNEEYEVVVYNGTKHEVCVDLKVDGLNVFQFADPKYRKPDNSKYRYYVIAPGTQMPVVGWRKDENRILRFKITPYEESALEQSGSSTKDMGLISATYFASWEKGRTSPPADEPSYEVNVIPAPRVVIGADGRERVTTNMQTATGFGVETIRNVNGVDRVIGVPRATVSLRYKSDE